jgi:hypothetical protein
MNLDDGRVSRFQPQLVIDATELGDLLPLAGAEYTVGAETVAQTGEKQAQPVEPKPHCVQSFTYTFACERRPKGENHVIPKPAKYEHYRDAQPYSKRAAGCSTACTSSCRARRAGCGPTGAWSRSRT